MALEIDLRRFQVQIHRRLRKHIHHPVVQIFHRKHDCADVFRLHQKIQQREAPFHKQREQGNGIKRLIIYCNHFAFSCKFYQIGYEISFFFLAVPDGILAIQPLIHSFSFT